MKALGPSSSQAVSDGRITPAIIYVALPRGNGRSPLVLINNVGAKVLCSSANAPRLKWAGGRKVDFIHAALTHLASAR